VTTTGEALKYGPEMWRTDAGVEWSYWDLWYAALCVRDHGGDWDGFDAAIAKVDRFETEARWSHLLDLRERLAVAGLSAGELVGEALGEKGMITRARARVFKQSLSERYMTPPMRNPPSLRLTNRARFGRWASFPSSPQEPYDRLVALFGLDNLGRRYDNDGWATGELAYDLAEAARFLESGDGPQTLAVRRAMLTIGLDLMECCDDSYGHLGEVIGEALEVYAGTDWRSAGATREVFWPDFLEIVAMLGNYGIVDRRAADLFRRTGVAHDLDAVLAVATELRSEYLAARMTWHAGQVKALHAHAVAAAGAEIGC